MRRRPLLLFLLASLPGVAAAQDPPEYYVETISGSETFDPRAPTGFVTDVEIDDPELGGDDLGDVLDSVPGVFVLRHSSFGQSAYASIRGGNPRQLSVSLAGVEVTIPAGLGFDLGTASSLGLQRARVFKGAAAVHRGSGALTGAVDLIPELREEEGNRLAAHAMGGSFGTFATGAEASVGTEWTSVTLGVQTRQSEGDFTFEDGDEEVTRINNDHDRQTAYGTMRLALTELDVFTTIARFETGERGTAGPSEFQELLRNARAEDSRAIVVARLDNRDVMNFYQSGSLDTYVALGGQWRGEHYTNDTTALGSGVFDSQSDYTAASADFGLVHYKEETFGERWASSIRLDFQIRGEAYEAEETGVFESDIDTTRSTVAFSASEELLLVDNYSALVGVRYETIDGEREESAWLPFLGLSARPLEYVLFRGNLAYTYRPPDFDELYINSEILRGDPDLLSERSLAVDLGVRLGDGNLWGEVVGFQNSVENPIRFLPVSVYLTQAQNLAEYTARGVETSGFYRAFDRLALEVGYTFTWASFDEVDAQVPAVPRHAARAGARMELAGWVPEVSRMQVGVDARYRGEVTLDLFGNIDSPGWVDLGAHVLVTPIDWLDVRFTAQNLLDRRDVTDVLQQPIPGRAFFLGFEVATEEP